MVLDKRYIRTLIHVLSLALYNQFIFQLSIYQLHF